MQTKSRDSPTVSPWDVCGPSYMKGKVELGPNIRIQEDLYHESGTQPTYELRSSSCCIETGFFFIM